MVVEYYNWGSAIDQCEIMERGYHVPPGTCCNNPQRCSRTGALEEIVAIIRRYGNTDAFITGPPPGAGDVYKALSKNKVVVAAISTTFGSGHVVVIRGIRRRAGVTQLLVNDPMSYLPQVVAYADLRQIWRQTVIVNYKEE